jgi:tetratricopeptide (TPR) repeat protein
MDENATFWDDAERVFADAIELEPPDRVAFLDRRCAGRPDLRTEVESLIAAHESARGFLDGDSLEAVAETSSSQPFAGRTIGNFRLVEKIGEGGMGIVFRAERADGEFIHHVAVKLIDAPVRGADALRAFRAERQILASLQHPHIVTLLDGGVTDDGQAYLVMERIDGVPITTYCAERRLPLEDRLRLFAGVCAAVQHAHGHAIVHRDLKPANILVTADGVAKVLDFGVAKLLDEPASRDGAPTVALRPLTPNYASPEQVRGLAVTIASDIYALGVLLYELLAGVRPYETADKTLDQILAIVVEATPQRPSAAAMRAEGSLPYGPSRLRGDLDAIVLKAMSKEPERRYASAREVSDDIARHLQGQAVIAREPSLAYVARTVVRRHRATLAATVIAVCALVGALGVSLWQMRMARLERDRATARFNDVRQLAGALIFTIHDQVRPLPGSTPVRRTIVAEALTYLERLGRDPRMDDNLRLELARAYHRIGSVQGLPSEANLGDREGAVASLRKALELLRPMTLRPVVSRDAALQFGRTALTFATTANVVGDREAAAAAARDAAAVADAQVRRNPSDDEARRLVGSALFQAALMADDSTCLPLWQRAGDAFDTLLAERPDEWDRQRNVALVQKYIGAYYQRQADMASAEAHYRRALAVDEKRLGSTPGHRQAELDVAIDLGNVGNAALNADRVPDAAAAFERGVAICTALAESDPKDVLARNRLASVTSRLALAYVRLGRTGPALDRARQAVRLGESLAHLDGEDQATFADTLGALGTAEFAAGHRTAACAAFQRAAGVVSALAGNPQTARLAARTYRGSPEGIAACQSGPDATARARQNAVR